MSGTQDTLDCPQFGGKCIFYPHENSNCTCRTVTWELMPEYRTEATNCSLHGNFGASGYIDCPAKHDTQELKSIALDDIRGRATTVVHNRHASDAERKIAQWILTGDES